ncbi:uncharacterized protein LOC133696690 isoform X2 [Populus nigra]|uniref:uncharacterized protein LOC133696690 isoform X2 n=1 Tax=Populus nigra TaxID=3691 RepID=UPI002B267CE7|nr:uncharacterized protein LOC133696690 isoform X2 [Populus nigra]
MCSCSLTWRGIVVYERWVRLMFWSTSSWWVTWILESPGFMMLPRRSLRTSRYLINSPQDQLTLYYEPHCVYNKDFLEKERANIVITLVIKQLLPKFTLVSGLEDAVQLAKLVQAKFIAPMKNGDLDSKGFLATIIQGDQML